MTEHTRLLPAPAEVWSVRVVRTDDGLEGLRAEWDGLVDRCRTATPFQTYAWLRAWWHSYGRPGTLRLVLLRRGGKLMAAAPLRLARRAGCPVLAPLGEPFADFTDVLIADAAPAETAGRLIDALIAEPGWQALALPECRPGAAALTALAPAWPGMHRRVPASLCLHLPAVPLEDLVRDLPAHSRKTVRRRLNQLGRAGLETREIEPADAARAVDELLRLHARQWAGRGGNPRHRTAAFGEFLTAACADMIAARQAALVEYRRAGRLVASSLVLIGGDLVGGYLFGAEPQLREHVDVTTMLLADTMPLAHRRGRATMSMLRGAEEHKRRWRPVESRNEELILARPHSARGVAYAIGVVTLRRAKQAAKRRAPWLREVRDRLRGRRR